MKRISYIKSIHLNIFSLLLLNAGQFSVFLMPKVASNVHNSDESEN